MGSQPSEYRLQNLIELPSRPIGRDTGRGTISTIGVIHHTPLCSGCSLSAILIHSGRYVTKNTEESRMDNTKQNVQLTAILPNTDGESGPCPTVMTEEELIQFLRIPEISRSKNHQNVIENLKRRYGLPRIHLCGKTVYLTDSVKAWLENHITYGQ